MKRFIQSILVITALLIGLSAALGYADAHAALNNVHIKAQAAPPTYLVDGKEVNAAEATVAVLQGKTAMKCTEMEVEAGRSGLSLKAKKTK